MTGWRRDLLRRSDLSAQHLAFEGSRNYEQKLSTVSLCFEFCFLNISLWFVFLGSFFFACPRRGHQGEYLDANPLERAPDGEVKASSEVATATEQWVLVGPKTGSMA